MRGVLSILVLMLLSCGLLWWFGNDGSAPPALVGAPAVPAAPSASAAAIGAADAVLLRERVDDGPDSNVPSADAATDATPARRTDGTVRGRVVFADGGPAAGAGVHAGGSAIHTGGDGTFTVEVQEPDADLIVWLAGQQPTVVTGVLQHPDVVAGRAIEVVLDGPPQTIDGWLRLADGTPATGWHLMLHGGTLPTGDEGVPRASAEDFAAGAQRVRSGSRMRLDHPNVLQIGDSGAFAVHGLRSGANYTLRAWNESTLQVALSTPIPAGSRGHVFVVPPGNWRDYVRGRTIGNDGGPMGDARVRLTLLVHRNDGFENYVAGQEVRTDANGWFRLEHVPHVDLLLRFDGDDVLPHRYELLADDPGDDLLVTLHAMCRVRCLRGPSGAAVDSLRVLDARNGAMSMTSRIGPGQTRRSPRTAWAEEQAAIEFAVSDAAAWLVLEADRSEIGRVPLRLRRGEEQVVQL